MSKSGEDICCFFFFCSCTIPVRCLENVLAIYKTVCVWTLHAPVQEQDLDYGTQSQGHAQGCCICPSRHDRPHSRCVTLDHLQLV